MPSGTTVAPKGRGLPGREFEVAQLVTWKYCHSESGIVYIVIIIVDNCVELGGNWRQALFVSKDTKARRAQRDLAIEAAGGRGTGSPVRALAGGGKLAGCGQGFIYHKGHKVTKGFYHRVQGIHRGQGEGEPEGVKAVFGDLANSRHT